MFVAEDFIVPQKVKLLQLLITDGDCSYLLAVTIVWTIIILIITILLLY